MKQNTFERHGVIYIAVPDKTQRGCGECDLEGKGICHEVPCLSLEREDGKESHWEAFNGRPV